MALLKIARLGHPVIRRPAATVPAEELKSKAMQRLIDDMIDTMRDAEGVGIAAPQVHVSRRLIVIEVNGDNSRYPGQPEVPLTVIANPQIVEHAADTETGWEGCLSIPDLRGMVPRWTALKVTGLDRHGRPVTYEAKGFFARVVQHEVDHLDGHVYIDRVKNLNTLTHLQEFLRYWLRPAS